MHATTRQQLFHSSQITSLLSSKRQACELELLVLLDSDTKIFLKVGRLNVNN